MTEAKKSIFSKKKRRTGTVVIWLDETDRLEVKIQALSSTELDELRSQHPPNAEQRAAGAGVNEDTFAPALFAACSVEPKISEKEALEIWQSDDWSAGELSSIFSECSRVCLSETSIPPSASV